MSQTTGSALPPAATISSAALKIVPGSFGCGSAVLAAMDDVGAVARQPAGDGQADAAAGPEMKIVWSRNVMAPPVLLCGESVVHIARQSQPPTVAAHRASP